MRYTNLSKYSLDRLEGLLEEHYRGDVVLKKNIKEAIKRIINFKKQELV